MAKQRKRCIAISRSQPIDTIISDEISNITTYLIYAFVRIDEYRIMAKGVSSVVTPLTWL